MRVLWLSNIQTVGSNNGVGCSWIGSLEAELSKSSDIQLGISFNTKKSDISKFTVGSMSYFPVNIAPTGNKLKRIIDRFTHKIEGDSNLQVYLDIVQQFKPDLIHIFGTESEYGLIIPRMTIPCIIHIQGNLTVINHKWYSGLSASDIFKYSDKWLLIKGHGLYHYYISFKKAVERELKISKMCHYYMGRTDWDRRISSVLSPDSKYFHCDEIMRSEFYLQQWLPQPVQTNYIIISTFKNAIYKGLETLFECKKILNRFFPEFNIIWRIVGLIEKDEVPYLVERKHKAKLKDNNIQLLGHLQENELIAELLKADLFVHPSHIENSSNSICEAMLLGMPVISTFAGGTPSILIDKIEGLLVQDGDPYVLAGAIIELYRDREYAKSLGLNARKKSLVRNDPKKIVNDVLRIYSSILEVT